LTKEKGKTIIRRKMMKKYKVVIKEIETYIVNVTAESENNAFEIADLLLEYDESDEYHYDSDVEYTICDIQEIKG